MADADVDGSHIRTLLLTFFFRQMKPLIEHGHLFIAQPPLYSVKVGKKQTYLPDEKRMTEYLVERAAEKRKVKIKKTNKDFGGKMLARRLEKLQQYRYFVEKLHNRRVWQDVVELMCAAGLRYKKQFEKTTELTKLGRALKREGYSVEPRLDEEHNLYELVVSGETSGGALTINYDLVDSAAYRATLSFYQELAEFHEPPFVVYNNGTAEATLNTKEELLSHLMSAAKRGITLQRYKGLGEMNAEQLWETTMDPEARRLLQVAIEDEVAADEVVTVLMGDKVEPRRAFIQAHAHEVENLDI